MYKDLIQTFNKRAALTPLILRCNHEGIIRKWPGKSTFMFQSCFYMMFRTFHKANIIALCSASLSPWHAFHDPFFYLFMCFKYSIDGKETEATKAFCWRLSPINSITLCFSDKACIWVSRAVLWDMEAQQSSRVRVSVQESGCGWSVSRSACLFTRRAVPRCISTEQRVCTNKRSCVAFTPNLAGGHETNTGILDQKTFIHVMMPQLLSASRVTKKFNLDLTNTECIW